MDPVKKETPISTADQTLIKETGGEPGIGNLEHPEQMRIEIGNSVGFSVIPETELAERKLGDAEKTGFLEAVAGIKPEGEIAQNKIPDSGSGLNELGEHLNALSPVGGSDEENVRTAPSGEFSELVKKRGAA